MASSPPNHPRSTAAWLKVSALGLGGAGLAYLAYRAYHGRNARWPTLACVSEVAQALSSASATSALLARDLHAYLASDEPELPASLRQVLRLAQSEEVRAALSSTSQAVLQGAVARAAGTAGAAGPEGEQQQDLTSRVLEAVLSDRGRGLVGMAVGLATRNATSSLCEFVQAQQREWAQQERGQGRTPAASLLASAMDLLSSEQGTRLLSVLVTKSMKTAVATYMESAAGFNPYDDLLASISKQGHRDAVSDIMSRVTAAFCREVAAACARASGEAPSAAVPATSHPSLHPYVSTPPASHSHQHKAGRRSSRSTRPSPNRPPLSSLTPSSTLSSAPSSSSSLNTLHQHSSAQDQQQLQQLPTHSQGNPTFEPGPAQEEDEQQQQQREGQEVDGVLEAQPAHTASTHIVLPPPQDAQGPQQEQVQQQQQQPEEQQQHLGGHEQPRDRALQGSYESSSAFALASSNADRAAHLLHGLHHAALHHRPYAQRQHGSVQLHTEEQQQQQQQQQSDQLQLPARSTAKSVWVRHLAELAREREVRTLCLDMVTSATREATYCTWDAVSSGVRASLPTSFLDVSGPVLARQAMACALLVLLLVFCMRCMLGWRAL